MATRLERPELLAPAGEEESLRAAVAAGADAVYFGLRGGFNARARADNFALENLPATFDYLHERGVKGYVAFNTLVYDAELDDDILALLSLHAVIDRIVLSDRHCIEIVVAVAVLADDTVGDLADPSPRSARAPPTA